MTANTRNALLALAAAVVVGTAIAYYIMSAEYEQRLVFDPQNGRLVSEQMHLLERWLADGGRQTFALDHLRDLDRQPARDSVLLTPTPAGRHGPLEARRLHAWIARGGHLVAPAPRRPAAGGRAGPVNPFGVRACTRCDDAGAGRDDAEPEPEPVRHELNPTGAAPIVLYATARLEVAENAPVKIWQSEQASALVVHYALGEGRVSLLAEADWLDDAAMLTPGAVRLIEMLTAGADRVLIQQRRLGGGLLAWLWQRAPLLWPALALVAALWVWSRMPRFGPVRPAGRREHRQMRTHVLATARFDWRHDRARALVAAMREELARAAAQREPGWRRMEPDARVELLDRRCPSIGRRALREHLGTESIHRADALIEHVRRHRRILETL